MKLIKELKSISHAELLLMSLRSKLIESLSNPLAEDVDLLIKDHYEDIFKSIEKLFPRLEKAIYDINYLIRTKNES